MVSSRLSASRDIQAALGHAIDQHALLKYSPLRELDVAERPGQVVSLKSHHHDLSAINQPAPREPSVRCRTEPSVFFVFLVSARTGTNYDSAAWLYESSLAR
jgi:hypothetical protein